MMFLANCWTFSCFNNEINFCEFYTGCNQTPCINPNTNYQKHHDLELDMKIDPKENYLIQYRHPLESITSLYNHGLKERRWYNGDSKETWIRFCNQNIKYWKGFNNRNIEK